MWFKETLYPDVCQGIRGTQIYKKTTPFQKLALYDTSRLGRMLVLDGAVQTTEKDEFIYHEMMAHPVLMAHPRPKKVLVIGGGDGGVIREVFKHAVEKVYLVEIDRDVIEISKKFLKKICKNAFRDKRLEVVVDDGARFIQNTRERFDIAIIDSSDPVGPAKVLFSRKFYRQVFSVLAHNGLMIRQSGSSAFQPDELRGNYKILQEIFPFVTVQLAAIPTYIGGFFSFLIGSKKVNPQQLSCSLIKQKFLALRLKTQYYNPEVHLGSVCLPTYIRRLVHG